jgi:NAD(P)-dependent dehydrogenase (short-subunit alcohol dehydrogenase family)
MSCHADVACAEEVNAMVEQVVTTYGGVDILINNAGLSIDAPFLELSEND